MQQPLSLGADAVVYSLSKGINGHFDVLVGAITTNDGELDQQLGMMQDCESTQRYRKVVS